VAASHPPGLLAALLPRAEVEHRGALLLFCAYVLLKPFYVVSSGLPQPADAIAVGALLLMLMQRTPALESGAARMLGLGAFFVGWVTVVDMSWALILGRARIATIPLFYLYNLLLVFAVLKLAARFGPGFFACVAWAAVASVLVQVALSAFGGATGRRQFLFFNNPNQLGYWSILSASVFYVCASHLPIRMGVQAAMALGATYLVLLSLSKAAMLSLVPLFALAFSRRPRHLLGAILAGAVLLGAAERVGLLDDVAHRLSRMGKQEDDSFAQRGYSFLWNFPHYAILGAGEGAPERFRRWDDHELHSTFATILFSYGAVGFALFGAWLWSVWASAGWWRFGFAAPAFLFGIAHQGLRFSTFWVLLALLAARPRAPGGGARGGPSPGSALACSGRRGQGLRDELREGRGGGGGVGPLVGERGHAGSPGGLADGAERLPGPVQGVGAPLPLEPAAPRLRPPGAGAGAGGLRRDLDEDHEVRGPAAQTAGQAAGQPGRVTGRRRAKRHGPERPVEALVQQVDAGPPDQGIQEPAHVGQVEDGGERIRGAGLARRQRSARGRGGRARPAQRIAAGVAELAGDPPGRAAPVREVEGRLAHLGARGAQAAGGGVGEGRLAGAREAHELHDEPAPRRAQGPAPPGRGAGGRAPR